MSETEMDSSSVSNTPAETGSSSMSAAAVASPPKTHGKIRKLDEIVINRIAAGEVIQRPANALKELIENSLDAGASNIQVVVKSGGMKLLQIQDDGCGIMKDDLPIVCERFTTSKLEKFEDLQSIATYGFRGEALASISHVAHLTIVTKTEDSACAYRAEYADGKLKEYPADQSFQNPRPCAGKKGTMITAEDLFYNMDTRRRALKTISDEHNKIVEVVTKYAIHNSAVGFSLKKFGEVLTEVKTQAKSSVVNNIKVLYGAPIARELLELKCEDKATGFSLKGWISNVNYSTKKLTFLLFINHRLVDSTALRKSIEALYYNYLPKGTHPFAYFGIEIDPKNVDVNVHPTKHEVHFLNEDMIVTAITNAAENLLMESNQSRTFYVQSLLPGASSSATAGSSKTAKIKESQSQSNSSSQAISTAPNSVVRTDPKLQKLDKFLSSTPNPDLSKLKSFQDSPSRVNLGEDTAVESNMEASSSIVVQASNNIGEDDDIIVLNSSSGTSANPQSLIENTGPSTSKTKRPMKNRREIRLRSIRNMRESIYRDTSDMLLTLFKNHTFVGCVDKSLAVVQHERNLFLCNTFRLTAELFYQKLVEEFGNFNRMIIEEPITIKELVQIAFHAGEQVQNGMTEEEEAQRIHNLLLEKSKMLDDYFGLSFDAKGTLITIPMILDNYVPSIEGIPKYIMNLARKVNWTEELSCFRTFCFETALFYAVQPGSSDELDETTLNSKSWKWTIEHVIYPEIKKSLRPPKHFDGDSTVVLVTSLPELYKVFERC